MPDRAPKVNARTRRNLSEAYRAATPNYPVASARKALLEHKLASPFTEPDDLIFGNEIGGALHPERCSDHLKATIKKAGLPERAVRFHGLRHFAVSRLIEAGANIVLLSKVAGHLRPDITCASTRI